MSAHALPSPESGLRRLRPLARRADDDLRALAARGDTGAFAELYERHHQALYRYCRSIVRHDEDAHDALHSTWANAWAALRDADRDVPVRPWLFRIAHNEAISVLRRRRDHSDLDEVVGAASGDLVEDDVAVRQRLAALRADLAELPERQRSALLLRELSGLGHEEIAAVHGVTTAAAKQSIYEARRALQEAEEGRSMICADVQRLLSDGDGRVRRGRRVRAHLRGCDVCAGFDQALRRRPADLALLAPPLPAAAAAGLLAQFLSHAGANGSGGGVASAGAAGAGASGVAGSGLATAGSVAPPAAATGLSTAGVASGVAATGSKVGAGLIVKLVVGAALVAGAGAGTVRVADQVVGSSKPPAVVESTPGATNAAGTTSTGAAGGPGAGAALGTTGKAASANGAAHHSAQGAAHAKSGSSSSHGQGGSSAAAKGNRASSTSSHGRSGSAANGKGTSGSATKRRTSSTKKARTKPVRTPKAAKPVKTPAVTKPSTAGSGTTTKPSKPAPTTSTSSGTTTDSTVTPDAGTTTSSSSLDSQTSTTKGKAVGQTSSLAPTS